MSRLTNQMLRGWLSGQKPGKYIQGPEIPDVAGAYILVTGLSGPGFDAEQAIDRPGVQIRTAGRALHPEEAESSAFEIDDIMINQEYPIYIGDSRVVMISRNGGAPAAQEKDDEDRTIYVCSYIIHHTA